jgi:hypothetical protein
MWQVDGHKSPASHSRTNKGARDVTQRVQKCGPSQSGLKTRPETQIRLRCPVWLQKHPRAAPKTRTKAKLGLRRPAPVASAASTAPAPSPAATGPSFAGWGPLALPGRGIAAPDVRGSRCLLALWLAIRLTVRGLYLGRSGAAMVGVPFLGDLDGQAVLLRILRDAHLGLQRADDVLEPAIVRRQHERVGSLAVGRADYFLRRLRRSGRALAPATRAAASSSTSSSRTAFCFRLLL